MFVAIKKGNEKSKWKKKLYEYLAKKAVINNKAFKHIMN